MVREWDDFRTFLSELVGPLIRDCERVTRSELGEFVCIRA
jgi:hypothetical protein